MKLPVDFRWEDTGIILGQGGQASVIQVKEKGKSSGNLYALKALSLNKPRQAYERFAREVEAIKVVDSPCVIRVVDHSKLDDDFHYYVMEFVQGARSLKKLIGTPENFYYTEPLKALDLFIQLLQAIRACQAVGIVHRDISPANILVLPNQRIKIIDFGICQQEGHDTITLIDEGVGTPSYMAPECESGGTGSIATPADLYSCGKVLWSAITNRNAFARESPVFTNLSMVELFPNRPDMWHLHHVFEKTIRANPTDRWEKADQGIAIAEQVQYLIRAGYPPIEKTAERCPVCGFGNIARFDGAHVVFGNPNPPGIFGLQCTYCGYCFAVNQRAVQERLQRWKQLQ
jgi:serine/threonine protein kinase